MNLSGPFIRRPIGTALLAIGLFMVGLICCLAGRAALPNIEIPVIFVQASQSGADAATMASTVTAPLERHLGQLPGIDRMRSSSSEGSSLVFMIFQSGHNIDSAALDVQTAINSAQADLPSGMGSPMYQKANPNDDPVIAIALTSQTQSADELYNVADSLLAQRIRQISGVASVDIAGASTPAVRVDVNLRLMNALGLTADDLRNAVRAANVTSPTGFLSDGNTTTAIIANDSVARGRLRRPGGQDPGRWPGDPPEGHRQRLRRPAGRLPGGVVRPQAGGGDVRVHPRRRQHRGDRGPGQGADPDPARLPAARHHDDAVLRPYADHPLVAA
jgi:multidrug efflux pump